MTLKQTIDRYEAAAIQQNKDTFRVGFATGYHDAGMEMREKAANLAMKMTNKGPADRKSMIRSLEIHKAILALELD